jgi:cell division protein FtsL
MKTTLTKTEKYSYSIVAGVVLLLLAFLCSCSAKTTTKSDVKNDSIAKTAESKKESINEALKEVAKSDSSSVSKKESEFISFLNELEFEPADPTKESSITENGKTTTFKNLKGKKRNQVNKSNSSSLETVNLIKTKNKEIHRKNQLIIERNIEIQKLQSQVNKLSKREQFNWGKFVLSLWWLWIVLAIAGYIAYKRINILSYLKFPKL